MTPTTLRRAIQAAAFLALPGAAGAHPGHAPGPEPWFHLPDALLGGLALLLFISAFRRWAHAQSPSGGR